MALPAVQFNPNIAMKPEILELAEAGKHRAIAVHLLAIIYVSANQLEVLPCVALPFVHGRAGDAAALVEVGLWQQADDGWTIPSSSDAKLHRPRVPVPKAIRRFVFDRDNYQCVTCGSAENLSIDHIVAWANGGSNAVENLQTLCLSCNSRKRDSS